MIIRLLTGLAGARFSLPPGSIVVSDEESEQLAWSVGLEPKRYLDPDSCVRLVNSDQAELVEIEIIYEDEPEAEPEPEPEPEPAPEPVKKPAKKPAKSSKKK